MLNSRILRQFIAVAEELNFSRAAERLHMAQPPLSQAIKNLEGYVGVSLFDRSRQAVALTDAGSVFLREARLLLLQEQRAIDAARRASIDESLPVSIGYVGTVAYGLLPAVLAAARSENPLVRPELSELASSDQLLALKRSEIDIGVLRLPVETVAPDVTVRSIATGRFVVALPHTHALSKSTSIALSELRDEAFVAFSRNKVPGLHAKFLFACDEAGFQPRIVAEAWQASTLVTLVASGAGIALVPDEVTCNPRQEVSYRPLSGNSDFLDLGVAVAWRSDQHSEAVDVVLRAIFEKCGIVPEPESSGPGH